MGKIDHVAVDSVEETRFAWANISDHADEFAFLHFKINIFQRDIFLEIHLCQSPTKVAANFDVILALSVLFF